MYGMRVLSVKNYTCALGELGQKEAIVYWQYSESLPLYGEKRKPEYKE